MKHSIFKVFFVGLLGMALIGAWQFAERRDMGANINKAAIEYGYKRPFSFYYPYNYQFYYPRPQYRGNSANACYWLYSNGNYHYYCED